MANEATLHIEFEPAISMNCIDANESHDKGTLLKLIDPFTVSGGGTLQEQACAGIAKIDKIKGYGTTTPVYRRGIFRMTLSGSSVAGNGVAMAASANKVYGVTASGANHLVGEALETGTDGETILV